MSRRKVMIFIPSFERGGVETNCLMVSNGLVNAGYDIDLVYARAVEAGPFNKLDSRIHKHKFQRFPLPLIHPRVIDFYSSLFFLFKYLILVRPQVIFSFQTSFAPLLLGTLLRVKVIPRVSNHPSAARMENSLLQKMSHLGKRYFYRLAHRVIVNSKVNLDYFENLTPGKVVLIHNPINLDEIKELSQGPLQDPYSPNVIKLISVGRLVEQKNHILLFKALAQLLDLSWELVLVGDGKLKEILMQEAEKLKIASRVKFVGHQSNPFSYITKADIFIQTSLYEGSPNALVEAMALGKVCVATDCLSGPREVLQDGKYGRLVKNNDIEDFVRVLKETISNLDYWKNHVQSIKDGPNRYSLEETLSKYEQIIAKS